MQINKLSFENFRNIEKLDFFPAKGINVIYGDNAQGKTNLIEGIWLFTGGRSFRGSKDSEMMSFGKKFSRLEMDFFSCNRVQNIKLAISPGKRSAILNDVPKNYLSQIIGSFCAVVFSPNHLSLVKSGPEERRSFIDGAICQIRPVYAGMVSRYRKVLNERNALLKDIPRHRELEDMLDIWNDRLAHEGAAIAVERRQYINELSSLATGFYNGISGGKESLEISYRTSCDLSDESNTAHIKENIISTLESKKHDDIYCGFTTAGVHRDDISVKINGRDARSFGSQGQQRSAVLSMKLAEAEILGSKKGEKPIILLDDVLSELDLTRQNYLLNKLDGMQVFITCCEKEIEAENRFRIENGKLMQPEG